MVVAAAEADAATDDAAEEDATVDKDEATVRKEVETALDVRVEVL